MERLQIESLDLKARGIAQRDGKSVLVDGALPGEVVAVTTLKGKASHEVARLREIVRASNQRVEPRCPHFGVCGGCSMQHLEPTAQVAVKQRILEETFSRIGSLEPQQILPALHGPAWHYRHRARLAVRALPNRGVIIGFRQRNSSYVADIQSCPVLPLRVSKMIAPLHGLVEGLSRPDRVPQIEVAVGDTSVALVLRHLTTLTPQDKQRLRCFGEQHRIQCWVQEGGPASAKPLDPTEIQSLTYRLPEFDLTLPFRPTDFTQVNPYINKALVSRAVDLLAPGSEDRVLDLFCGLGNFTLALARRAQHVVGIEFSAPLLTRAHQAAEQHGLHDRVQFIAEDLFNKNREWLAALGRFNRVLIDPPREGAEAIAHALAQMPPSERPQRIVYVSCNPTTLARDAAILTHKGGYRLRQAGVVNMFPHTAHVESIAVLE